MLQCEAIRSRMISVWIKSTSMLEKSPDKVYQKGVGGMSGCFME